MVIVAVASRRHVVSAAAVFVLPPPRPLANSIDIAINRTLEPRRGGTEPICPIWSTIVGVSTRFGA
jgi:hypothetical protein